MSALLAEPFTLASYPTPSQKYPQSSGTRHHKRQRHVSATCSSGGHGEGFVTVSVQGDGIHVLELSSLHASVSHTLGPSAFFAAAAVTRLDGLEASTSYAVMQSAPEAIDIKHRGRTVWWWKDRQSRRPEEPAEPKRSVVFPHSVKYIWAPSSLPSSIIAVSPSGEVMLADEDLTITSSTKPDVEGVLVKAWILDLKECAFFHNQNSGMAVMCFIVANQRMKLRITLAETTGTLKELADCDLGTLEYVIDISCDVSGYISILSQMGEWQFFRLSHDPVGRIVSNPLDGPLRLTGISFPDHGNLAISGPSIMSVGSSYVLLAGIVGGSSPEVALLLWDLQYSVVLASQTFALPSTLAYTPKIPPSLELIPGSRTQAVLVLSPAVSTGAQRDTSSVQTRSTVLVVPFEVPSLSTIALAMGKARDTNKWLQNIHSPSTGDNQDDGRRHMIDSVRQALAQGQAQAAEAAFFVWVNEETARLKSLKAAAPAAEIEVDSDEGAEPDTDHQALNAKRKWKNKTPTKPVLSHHFVSTIMDMTLSSSKASDAPYASKIVHYLLDRKAVGNAMVEGGLLPALAINRDWEGVTSALRNVPDIPETDLVKLLAEVVGSHRQHLDVREDSMQVDAPANVPRLTQYLAAVAAYKTSPPILRLALKQHLADTRDIMCVLEVLDIWVVRWCGRNMGLTPSLGVFSKEATQTPLGRKKKSRPSEHGMPPFEQVMLLLQCVFDTHFLSLLQYSPSHAVIERLAQQLREQLVAVDDLDRLRGPVESFVRMEAKKKSSRKAKKESEGDWRKKRKEFEAAELAIGLYQVEELTI